MPVDPDLDRIREVGADLYEPWAHPLVPDVDVEHQHPPLLLGEGELWALARVGVAFVSGPHRGILLRPADGHYLRTPRGSRLLQVRAHHLDLAIAGLERHHRHPVGLRPVLHVPAELRPDRLEQCRGRDRLTPVIVQEVHHPTRGLQLGHEPGHV